MFYRSQLHVLLITYLRNLKYLFTLIILTIQQLKYLLYNSQIVTDDLKYNTSNNIVIREFLLTKPPTLTITISSYDEDCNQVP